MAEAEQKARGGRRDRDDRERGWQRDRRERSLSRERRRSRSRERRERSRSGSRTRRRRSRSSDRRARRRNSRDRDSRSRSRERRSRSRERKRSRSPATASSKLKGSSSRFMKPGDMDTSDRSRYIGTSLNHFSSFVASATGFLQTLVDAPNFVTHYRRRSPERTSSWRKPGFMKAGESRNSPPKRRDSPPRRRRRRSSSSASSSSGASENERRPSKKFTKPEVQSRFYPTVFTKVCTFSGGCHVSFSFSERKRTNVSSLCRIPMTTALLGPRAAKLRRPLGGRNSRPSHSLRRTSRENTVPVTQVWTRRIAHCTNPLPQLVLQEKVRKGILSFLAESESESDHSEAQEQKAEETVVILSEDEMNKLGAKIMKAELMGNQVTNKFSGKEAKSFEKKTNDGRE